MKIYRNTWLMRPYPKPKRQHAFAPLPGANVDVDETISIAATSGSPEAIAPSKGIAFRPQS